MIQKFGSIKKYFHLYIIKSITTKTKHMSSLQYELETAQEKLRVYEEVIGIIKQGAFGIHMCATLEDAKSFGESIYKAIMIGELNIEAIDTNETEPAKVIANRFKGMDNGNDYLNEVKNTELS